MTLREAAALFGVSETAVLNWEIRDKMPEGDRLEMVKVKGFITNCSVH